LCDSHRTHFTRGCLYRTEGDFEGAKTEYLTAKTLWIMDKNSRTHHFHGICLYKLGCVALDQDFVSEAVERLREALMIAALRRNIMMGQYARVLYKLSEALQRDPESQVEAEEKRDQAMQILMKARPQRGVSSEYLGQSEKNEDCSEATYDELIYVLWR
jgi:tetratricopeptide (TPR) repeat protein